VPKTKQPNEALMLTDDEKHHRNQVCVQYNLEELSDWILSITATRKICVSRGRSIDSGNRRPKKQDGYRAVERRDTDRNRVEA